MGSNDDFYNHFPSLNSNSKENQRNKRISSEYTDYMKNLTQRSPKYTKNQQRMRRSKENALVESLPSPSSSEVSEQSSMDVIFSAEERNKVEHLQKEEKKKIYQISLQRQIEEQRLKKQKEVEKRKRDEMLLEERLKKQIENIRKSKDPQADQVVERICLSENEKEVYNTSKLSNMSKVSNNTASSTSSNNDVYRYFSHSAKLDYDLFNYKKYFSDILLDHVNTKHEHSLVKKLKSKEIALKKAEPNDNHKPKTKKPVIDNCPSCSSHTECSRCHKKLEMYCKECNEQHDKPAPEVTKQLQIEHNEPESLPFSNDQQVVVYRPNDQNEPYSFNIDPNSKFYKDTMTEMRNFSEMKIANYIKLYGDLRKKKLEDEYIERVITKPTGAVPKRRAISDIPEKNLTHMTSKPSELEDILSNAPYTVITQVGFAKKHLELEKLKL